MSGVQIFAVWGAHILIFIGPIVLWSYVGAGLTSSLSGQVILGPGPQLDYLRIGLLFYLK